MLKRLKNKMRKELENIKKVHFVGVGGTGVSALARYFVARGVQVSGSDKEASPITEALGGEGVEIFLEHKASNLLSDVDALVYSPAISDENVELKKARELNIQTFSYPEMLGEISRDKFTIAVAGTHGKTTTTAMIAEVLIEVEKSPTVIVGSIMSKTKSNFLAGDSDIFLVEACEYKRSFLNLSPDILVITNIEEDHLDYYKDLVDIQSAFAELISKVPKDGFVVCNTSDPNVQPLIQTQISAKSARQGLACKALPCRLVDYMGVGVEFKLPVLGEYNVQNARVAIAVASLLGVPVSKSVAVLENFKGTWRRQEYKGCAKSGASVYDDYAHHPTEIKKTLAGFRMKFPDKKIVVVFESHMYSRTKLLLNDFAQSFNDVNEVIVAPIYAAREKKDGSITEEVLAGEIKKYNVNTKYVGDFNEIVECLESSLAKNDILITMGAGDVNKVAEKITLK